MYPNKNYQIAVNMPAPFDVPIEDWKKKWQSNVNGDKSSKQQLIESFSADLQVWCEQLKRDIVFKFHHNFLQTLFSHSNSSSYPCSSCSARSKYDKFMKTLSYDPNNIDTCDKTMSRGSQTVKNMRSTYPTSISFHEIEQLSWYYQLMQQTYHEVNEFYFRYLYAYQKNLRQTSHFLQPFQSLYHLEWIKWLCDFHHKSISLPSSLTKTYPFYLPPQTNPYPCLFLPRSFLISFLSWIFVTVPDITLQTYSSIETSSSSSSVDKTQVQKKSSIWSLARSSPLQLTFSDTWVTDVSRYFSETTRQDHNKPPHSREQNHETDNILLKCSRWATLISMQFDVCISIEYNWYVQENEASFPVAMVRWWSLNLADPDPNSDIIHKDQCAFSKFLSTSVALPHYVKRIPSFHIFDWIQMQQHNQKKTLLTSTAPIPTWITSIRSLSFSFENDDTTETTSTSKDNQTNINDMTQTAAEDEKIDSHVLNDNNPNKPSSLSPPAPLTKQTASLYLHRKLSVAAFIDPYLYVDNGYRPSGITFKQTLFSAFQLHNETVNIWTELCMIPFIFLFLGLYPTPSRWNMPGFTNWSVMLYYSFLAHAFIVRPLTSAAAHLFYCANATWYRIAWGADYTSIVWMMFLFGLWWNDYVWYTVLMHYGNNNSVDTILLRQVQDVGWISLCAFMCIVIVINVSNPITTNMCLGSLFSYPLFGMIRFLINYQVPPPIDVQSIWIILLGSFGLLCSLAIKILAIPERWFPGKFNTIGASHMWWHIFLNASVSIMVWGAWTSK